MLYSNTQLQLRFSLYRRNLLHGFAPAKTHLLNMKYRFGTTVATRANATLSRPKRPPYPTLVSGVVLELGRVSRPKQTFHGGLPASTQHLLSITIAQVGHHLSAETGWRRIQPGRSALAQSAVTITAHH